MIDDSVIAHLRADADHRMSCLDVAIADIEQHVAAQESTGRLI